MLLVLNTMGVYLFLLIMFRIAGRRTMTQVTMFDLVLVLVISETVQNALIGEDRSVTGAFLVITTLVGVDVLFAEMKARSDRVEKWIDGMPLIVVREGKPLEELMSRARIDLNDILQSARISGIGTIEEIDYAVLETNGRISVIPKRVTPGEGPDSLVISN